MQRALPWIFLLAACTDPPEGSPTDRAVSAEAWVYESSQGGELIFSDGSFFDTGLHDLTYIDQLPRPGFAPYLIFSGRSAAVQSGEIGLYVHSPSDGPLNSTTGHDGQHCPGRLHRADGSVYYEARTFYGEVLPDIIGVIWYARITLKNGVTDEGAALLDLSDPDHHNARVIANAPIAATLELLADGRCHEIPGIDQTVEPGLGGGVEGLMHH